MADELVRNGALAEMLRPVRGRLAIGMILAGFAGAFTTVPFVAVAEIARALLTGAPQSTGVGMAAVWVVWTWVAVGTVGGFLRVLFAGAASAVCHVANGHFEYAIRLRLARKLGSLPLGWFTDNGSGEVKKAVSDDVKAMHQLVSHSLIDLTAAVVAPLTAIAYLLVVDWRMTVAVVGFIAAVVALVSPAISRTYRANIDGYNRAQGELSKATVELADGIAVVKTFGTGARAFRRFSTAASEFTRTCMKWTTSIGRPATAMNLGLSAGTMVVWILAVGLVFTAAGWAKPVDMLPFLAVGVGLPAPYLRLGSTMNMIRNAQLGATHVHQLLELSSLPEPARPVAPAGGRVEFDGVKFSYGPAGELAVDGIDLTLEEGTVTALVGPSGSGKSTLARLLPRFWDPTEGSIRLGGADLREIGTAGVLDRVAIVFQDVVLVRETVRENIRLGRPDATDEQVEAAAKAAQIHDVIMDLPDGYDTVVGAGAEMSGGERQRVTIARALVKDTPVVVLDEATAHADPECEAAIQDALTTLAAGRTVLVIAHRLHTIAGADNIVVLDHGRIVESGRHADLVAADGEYRRMWDAQVVPVSSAPLSPLAPLTPSTPLAPSARSTGGVA